MFDNSILPKIKFNPSLALESFVISPVYLVSFTSCDLPQPPHAQSTIYTGKLALPFSCPGIFLLYAFVHAVLSAPGASPASPMRVSLDSHMKSSPASMRMILRFQGLA